MTNGEAYMIKTYLVPTTYEMVEAMEKGEAPSFLHCATCLDGLTNGEVLMKIYNVDADDVKIGLYYVNVFLNEKLVTFNLDWWNRKWGEQT